MTLGENRPVVEPVPIDWIEARDALREQVGRVTALLRSGPAPDAPALGRWNLGEVAMHLSQAWIIVPGLAGDDLSGAYELLPHLAGRAGPSLLSDVWDLADATVAGVNADPERDPKVLADRIDERARRLLGSLDAESAAASHAWLVEGVVVQLPTLLCHLLNETIVHGYDIARAAGRSWPIPRSHAALVLDGFLVPVVSALGPRAMVNHPRAKSLQATFEIHIRGGRRHLFIFDDGTLSIERPGTRKVDCHISAAPAAMLLVAWGRRSQWPAIARGQFVAWGRKPWLGPRFRTLLRSP